MDIHIQKIKSWSVTSSIGKINTEGMDELMESSSKKIKSWKSTPSVSKIDKDDIGLTLMAHAGQLADALSKNNVPLVEDSIGSLMLDMIHLCLINGKNIPDKLEYLTPYTNIGSFMSDLTEFVLYQDEESMHCSFSQLISLFDHVNQKKQQERINIFEK